MKKYILFMLMLLLIVTTSCNSQSNQSDSIGEKANFNEKLKPQKIEENIEDGELVDEVVFINYPKGEVAKEGIIYSENGLEFVIKSVFYHDDYLQIVTEIINNTEDEVRINKNYCLINGYQVNNFGDRVIPSMKKAIFTEDISYEFFEAIKSKEVVTLQLSYLAGSYYENLIELPLMDVETKFANKSISPVFEEGFIVFDEGGIKLYALDFKKELDTLIYDFCIINNSDGNIMVYLENYIVNEHNIYGSVSDQVDSGNMTVMEMVFEPEMLELLLDEENSGGIINVLEDPSLIKNIIFSVNITDFSTYETISESLLEIEF